MSGNDELFEFPGDFPIKVMGRDSESFRTLTLAIVERHAGSLAPDRISERSSNSGISTKRRGEREVCGVAFISRKELTTARFFTRPRRRCTHNGAAMAAVPRAKSRRFGSIG